MMKIDRFVMDYTADKIGIDPFAYDVYPKSVNETSDGLAFMANAGERDVLVVSGALTQRFFGRREGELLVCELDHENACALREVFTFTAPVPVLRHERSIGVGDRLGIATPGHIRVFERYDAYPVFAQQSIRELNLTNRDYENVLDCATFAVYREGFRRGFGADGDHLKTPAEVEYALKCGYTMITLDCSEHIVGGVDAMSMAEVEALYTRDEALEQKYLDTLFKAGDTVLEFGADEFKRMSVIYGKAIDFAVSIYDTFIKDGRYDVDFEISIDETATPTTPAQHFFVANELIARGVNIATMAPRFCGEFQKGIDYIGDLKQFEAEFIAHAEIAKHFGYKLSVHSGSDKFSVFPIVGRYCGGRFHLKTAGTNWLEAMRVVAMTEPALYREVHAFALESFDEARKYYHVTTVLENIPALDVLKDAQLPGLFDQNDARQLIHITYGLILNAKNGDGSDRFRTRLYRVWREHESEYESRLDVHIGRHAQLIYEGINAAE